MKLILIRHTSVSVAPGICYGHTDVDLASTFIEEASMVKNKLKEYSFDKVYSSPLNRCKKLTKFCGFEDFEIDPRIIEMNFGDWEMKRFDEITDPILQDWYKDYMNVIPTNGESAMQQRNRFANFISQLRCNLPDDSTVALFTHGGILVHALNIFTGKDYDELFRAIPAYGSVIELNI